VGSRRASAELMGRIQAVLEGLPGCAASAERPRRGLSPARPSRGASGWRPPTRCPGPSGRRRPRARPSPARPGARRWKGRGRGWSWAGDSSWARRTSPRRRRRRAAMRQELGRASPTARAAPPTLCCKPRPAAPRRGGGDDGHRSVAGSAVAKLHLRRSPATLGPSRGCEARWLTPGSGSRPQPTAGDRPAHQAATPRRPEARRHRPHWLDEFRLEVAARGRSWRCARAPTGRAHGHRPEPRQQPGAAHELEPMGGPG
jgi:hypothetical protein